MLGTIFSRDWKKRIKTFHPPSSKASFFAKASAVAEGYGGTRRRDRLAGQEGWKNWRDEK
jgi:hypothetical protein